MPQSIELWSQQQWGVFVAVVAAGLLAALLAPVAVRVRADYRLHRPYPAPRPPRHAYAMLPDDVETHVAPGPGSLTSLRETVGHIAEPEPLVDADVRADLDAALSAALESFRVAVEPAMRKARLWTLQAGETYAENALRTWHILEITGEYPMVVQRGQRA